MKNFKVLYKTPFGLHFEADGRKMFIDWRNLGEAMLNNHLRETLSIAECCSIEPCGMVAVLERKAEYAKDQTRG